MNRLRSLLAVALVGWAGATCCWAADPEAPDGPPAQAARLPPVTSDDATPGESDRPPAEEPDTTSDVSLAAYEEFVDDDEMLAAPVAPVNPNATRIFESTWYTRVDYFYWSEVIDGTKFMENNGAVPTLGYQQRHGRQRYRAELFGGRVDYFAIVNGLDDNSVTDYLGLRGEYELMFESKRWPRESLIAGIGTRFFVRNTPDIILQGSLLVDGYQEAWWTFYPYIGAEKRRTMKPGWEFYSRSRIGVTAFTWEHVTLRDVTLFPRANLIVQGELGFRGPRWHLSAFTEIMGWSASRKVLAYDDGFLYEIYQPASINILLGLKTGYSY